MGFAGGVGGVDDGLLALAAGFSSRAVDGGVVAARGFKVSAGPACGFGFDDSLAAVVVVDGATGLLSCCVALSSAAERGGGGAAGTGFEPASAASFGLELSTAGSSGFEAATAASFGFVLATAASFGFVFVGSLAVVAGAGVGAGLLGVEGGLLSPVARAVIVGSMLGSGAGAAFFFGAFTAFFVSRGKRFM